jgi:hypothetical protein
MQHVSGRGWMRKLIHKGAWPANRAHQNRDRPVFPVRLPWTVDVIEFTLSPTRKPCVETAMWRKVTHCGAPRAQACPDRRQAYPIRRWYI